jgi:hypothetical protein
MNKKNNKEKRIDEDMTIGELAIMVNNGFTNMQTQINDLRVDMVNRFEVVDKRFNRLENRFDVFEKDVNKRFDTVDKRFQQVENRFDKVDKKFDIIDKNMTNPYEFQNLVLRVDKIEEKTR